MINVLIADDHAVVRDGLKQFLSLMGDIHVAGEATNGAEVLDLLQGGNNFDLLLLDLTMPGICGAPLITRIRTLNKSLPILIFTMHNELLVVKRMLQAGANGFITKGSAQKTLVAGIRKVAAGGQFIDPALAEIEGACVEYL